MSHSDVRPLANAGASCAAVLDRRQSERCEVTKPCVYVFNEAQGETFVIYSGSGVVRDISTGGMCIQLDGQPRGHGILEVRTGGPGETEWVWLLGITWARQISDSKGPASLVGGRFLFGCCSN